MEAHILCSEQTLMSLSAARLSASVSASADSAAACTQAGMGCACIAAVH